MTPTDIRRRELSRPHTRPAPDCYPACGGKLLRGAVCSGEDVLYCPREDCHVDIISGGCDHAISQVF